MIENRLMGPSAGGSEVLAVHRSSVSGVGFPRNLHDYEGIKRGKFLGGWFDDAVDIPAKILME